VSVLGIGNGLLDLFKGAVLTDHRLLKLSFFGFNNI
jgi:hypothetical protein